MERPQPDRRNLVIYALLDSPRATGAYRMVLTPGKDSTLDVQARCTYASRWASSASHR